MAIDLTKLEKKFIDLFANVTQEEFEQWLLSKKPITHQTALEQLIEWISSDCTPMDCVMKAKELLKVERDQHRVSWVIGNNTQRCNTTKEIDECFDDYYNEIYKKTNKIIKSTN